MLQQLYSNSTTSYIILQVGSQAWWGGG